MNYQNCLEDILSLEAKGIHRGLDRMETALRLLGEPQLKYPTLHVAGTNGKGSVCAFMASILKSAHFKTGLTISPHVEDFRERIQINGEWISKEAVVEIHTYLKKKIGHVGLTFFEWVTVMAFLYFAESRVDMAVLETGMGGRWDATNMAKPLVGVITNVTLDHQTILGNTTTEILAEKREILKPGMVAWTGIGDPALFASLKTFCDSRKVQLYRLSDYYRDLGENGFSIFDYRGLQCNLLGAHQRKNAALAVATVSALSRLGYSISSNAIKEGLMQVAWPGRLEVISKKPFVLLDGAHNEGGISVLAEFLKESPRSYHLVFGCLNDRPMEDLVRPLLPLVKKITWAHFESRRSHSLEELRTLVETYASRYGVSNSILEITPDNWKSFKTNLGPDESVLVTGSLYLVSLVRQFL